MTFGTVTNFDGHATVRFGRHVSASPATLWASLTDEAALSVWLAPGIIEPHFGGTVRFDFGEDQQVAGEVLEHDPLRVIEYTWTFTGEPDSVLRFELEETTEGVNLVLEHRLLPPDQAVGYGAGWHAHLDMLEAHVTESDPVDWDKRFGEVLGHYAGA